jgi:VWFA-related protein
VKRHLSTAVASLAVLTLGSSAGSQTPSFPAGTELVTVDAVVQDKDGNPVLDLKAGDFTVLENGVPQEIVAFEAVDRPALRAAAEVEAPAAGALPRTTSNVDAAAKSARNFVIVFDERHMDVAEAARGRKALATFLETATGRGDRVTLAGTQTGASWTVGLPEGRSALLQVLDKLQGRRQGDLMRDAISDYEAMRIDRETDWIVIDRVTRRLVATNYIRRDARLPGDPADDGSNLETERGTTRARAAQVYAKATLDNEATLAVLERALQGLGEGRGRKSLILVSGGFIQDSHISAFRRVVTAALRANVAIYFLDARGIAGVPQAFTAEQASPLDFNDLGATLTDARNDSEGSDGIAMDTGGFSVRNENDLAAGLDRIDRESRSYYLLGYKPAEGKADGRFRKLEVKVARDHVRVGARRGYYAPEASAKAAPEGADAAFQRALDSPIELADVPLRATTHVFEAEPSGKLKVAVTPEADVRNLAFQAGGNGARDTLELLLVVTNRESAEFFRFDQQFAMNFKPDTRARYERTWFAMPRSLDLVPGSYQARVIVRDRNSGRVGSLTHDFDVPEAVGLRVSTPVLSDRLRDEQGAAHVPELTANRSFAPTGVLHCRFEVYGAGKDAKTGAPNVTAGFSIRRSDGKFLAAAPETPLASAPDGSLSRSFGTNLAGAPPGHYEMIVLVTDLAAGTVAEAREPFTIAATPAAP